MKLFTGWVMLAGLVLAATSANAQVQAPGGTPGYAAVSDFNGPYAAMPPAGPGYGPRLLPATEVYTVLRDSGFSPLGIPRQRGFFYTISVINRRGDDGRLVIDARDGRIVRFMPADHFGANYHDGSAAAYGPPARLPPVGAVTDEARPPESVPKMASRTPPVPLPKAMPPRLGEPKPLAEKPAPAPVPAQQSAANQVKPAEVSPAPAPAAPATVEAKPSAPQIIQPTQEMPKVQGLE
ncbi:hypothetical protein [Bradyrhizobium canariense]|uniref:Uncharacterized protein n=1 Tax=Bradyrhizobium canariense TaxID=255045 RepID=A0A1H1WIG5_9BRAD|nr:hypothetical protein [Bradyrhizobium canariense]SDS96782.1 hypothetical protein SAMN05444158_3865 [Bradyrhizobium canariense]